MSQHYCYWSVADGDHADMMKTVVCSARASGVQQDFHVWTDRPIPGATCYPARRFEKSYFMFKYDFLYHEIRKLNYDLFIFIDSDSYFVRSPGNVLRVLQGSPVHSSLESDACAPTNVRSTWWDCPLSEYAALMRLNGVKSRSIFNVNSGFWIVHWDVIELFCQLAFGFSESARRRGYVLADEGPLAYATQMLCGNPYRHMLRNNADVWASDWRGHFGERIPDGTPWRFAHYLSGEEIEVNSAIVHCMRSKTALIQAARKGSIT